MPTQSSHDLDELCINTIRTLSVDGVQKANSGHPGTPMALAPAAYVLFTKHLKHDATDPHWPDRDRFVLSCGHASMLLYSTLHLAGYGLTMEDLESFRQWGSRTPGHPELGHAPGIETTTGPLGQGLATAVGMAMAESLLAKEINRPEHAIVDHRIWGFCSDGDLMEGVSHEAAGLAGHLGLGKLNFLYDDNHITIDGPTELSYTDNVPERFAAYGWHVLRVDDANDLEQLDDAYTAAAAELERPTLIVCRSHIAYGAPTKQDSASAHGEPLGADEIAGWKERIAWTAPAFTVPAEVHERFATTIAEGQSAHAKWRVEFDAWAETDPARAAEWTRRLARELPKDWTDALPAIQGDKLSTRKASGAVLAAIAETLPELVGGSGDLTPSNNTLLGSEPAYERGIPGRYIHYGIREFGMAAAMNGMVIHGGLRPYGGTFLVFSDYMRGAIRLAALMEIPTIFVYTHDSIGLGEDGPTHQPIEHLASLRAMPGLQVIRPGDAAETVAGWKLALEHLDGPSAMALTRQDLPILVREGDPAEGGIASADGLEKGAYVLTERGPSKPAPDVILIGTGSEVSLCIDAADRLAVEGTRVRVVSMPVWELFEAQTAEYRNEVLPPEVRARVSVEAAATFGWERWTGSDGAAVGIDRFGASAPGSTVMKEFGFTPEHVADAARSLLP